MLEKGHKQKQKIDLHSMYTHHTHNLKVIVYNIFNNSVHETKFHGVEFPTGGNMSAFKNFWVLEHLRFLD